MKILVVGSLNMDTTYILDHIPKIGETIISNLKSTQKGGKGQNQAIQVARLGGEISMIGAVGDDAFGRAILEDLKSENINTEGIIVKENASTGTASIYVDKDGRNNIVVYSGANFLLNKKDIDEKIEIIKNSDIVIMQNEIPKDVIYYVLKICKENEIITIHNPAPAVSGFDYEKLCGIHYFMPNESELELMLGEEIGENIEAAARKVLNRGLKNVIVTLGSKGSLFVNEKKTHYESAKKVKAVDTTGAGDSFVGAFAYGISKNMNEVDAIEFATKVSAISVTEKGAADSLPTLKKVESFKF